MIISTSSGNIHVLNVRDFTIKQVAEKLAIIMNLRFHAPSQKIYFIENRKRIMSLDIESSALVSELEFQSENPGDNYFVCQNSRLFYIERSCFLY